MTKIQHSQKKKKKKPEKIKSKYIKAFISGCFISVRKLEKEKKEANHLYIATR